MNYRLRIILIFSSTLFLTFFIFNVKSLIILFIFSFVIILFFTKFNFFETSIITFLLSIPFENSIRQWTIYASPFESFDNYFLYFGITPKMVFGLLVLLQIIFFYKLAPKIKVSKLDKYLLAFLIFSVLSSLFFQSRLLPVLTGLSRLFLAIFSYFIGQYFFNNPKNKYIISIFFISLTFYSVFFGINQFVRQQTLGKFIELTPSFSKTGYTTTDGESQYRVSGYVSHPVYFGSLMSILTPIILGLALSNFIKKTLYWYPLLILGFLSIIVTFSTLSRSSWINLVVIATSFLVFVRLNNLNDIFLKIFKSNLKIPIILIGLLTLIPLVKILSVRIESIPSLFSDPKGSAGIRLKFLDIGLKLGISQPLTGIGLNNYPFEAKIQGFSPDFSAPPHNTFMIFITELGLPTTILFILFLINLLWPKKSPLSWTPEKFGIWIGLLTFIISSQFHPLFNLDPTFDIFMLSAGIFSNLCQQS